MKENSRKILRCLLSGLAACGRNRVLLACLMFCLYPATPSYASSAPALLGVQEVLLQYARFGSDKAEEACGVTRGEVEKYLQKSLAILGVPVVAMIDAKPPMLGVSRIDLLPEIVSYGGHGAECTSWVALTAQTQNTIRIPPVETPRSVTVTYWKAGMLVNSNTANHSTIILDAFGRLGDKFSRQYKLDQPPPLPTFEEQ